MGVGLGAIGFQDVGRLSASPVKHDEKRPGLGRSRRQVSRTFSCTAQLPQCAALRTETLFGVSVFFMAGAY